VRLEGKACIGAGDADPLSLGEESFERIVTVQL
jgi:hypothetical protein